MNKTNIGLDVQAIFANYFYVHSSNGTTRIAFGEQRQVSDKLEKRLNTAIVLSNADARELGELLLKYTTSTEPVITDIRRTH